MIVAKKAARALPAAALKTVSDAIEAHLAAVEALTKFLDEIDGDHDMEPSSSRASTCLMTTAKRTPARMTSYNGASFRLSETNATIYPQPQPLG